MKTNDRKEGEPLNGPCREMLLFIFWKFHEPDVGNRLFAWTRLVLERQIRSGVQEIDTFSVCVCWGGMVVRRGGSLCFGLSVVYAWDRSEN